MAIAIFFVSHWFLSLFSQTFFLHRYAAHKMFTMSKFWERFFYVFTFITQGSSFLNPRAYAIMHRMHHAYSDTEKDPHSPHYFSSMIHMMLRTKDIYLDHLMQRIEPERGFDKNVPEWRLLDEVGKYWTPRLLWGIVYTLFYVAFATEWWMFLLLPVHFLMGPIHGAIVNWFGHKYGYVNHPDTHDLSKNSLPFDFVTLGELFQNNHHKYPSRVNFATRWFEVDPTYPFIKLLAKMRIIRLVNETA
ncbi:MAG: acyl-CoA desaturase [Bacteroidetes bacterium]|jgi:stearoyl-CoA desaturase (delta-9 desaturase)|nr:acyl-CoA desaturase [Bacteroidota bacterium]